MQILVLDDDKFFLGQMKKLLELENHSVVITASSNEALQKLKQNNYDLILTDLKMPELSGMEFINKAKKIGNGLKFIVITGYGTIESAVEVMKLGAYDYLRKPFEFSILKDKIKEIEKSITLRGKIKFPESLQQLIEANHFEMENMTTKFDPPFLVISDSDPEVIIEKYNIPQSTPISLPLDENNNETVQSVKQLTNYFFKHNSKGTVLFKLTETSFQGKDGINFMPLLFYVQAKISLSNIQLLILVEKKKKSISDQTFDRILSSLMDVTFDKMIKLMSHPLRRRIIARLESHPGMGFNNFVNELSIESPSVLAFHLKKLVTENILLKEKSFQTFQYFLSSKGTFLAEVISLLEKIGEQDPFLSTKVIEILD